jgi:predicted DNA-binding antitoxin AbrB/MazE fold protein
MNHRVEAVFENGMFRPETPVEFVEGQRVALNVEPAPGAADDLSDVKDLLDVEFIESCAQQIENAPSLEEVRKILTVFHGSLAERILQERDEQ